MRRLGLLLLVIATNAWPQALVHEPGGVRWFPDRLRTGPTTFALLGTDQIVAGPGTYVWCGDCQPTCPATGGGPGAHCFRTTTEWCCGTSGGAMQCDTSCVEGTVPFRMGPNCEIECCPDPCTPDPCGTNFCVITSDCMAVCVSAVTTTTITATTTTTSTTGATTTTTTATTTTSTTTSTLAAGPSVSFLWVPSIDPPENNNVETYAVSERLYCNAWVPELGIEDATSIVFVTSGTGNCGVAIYNADGSSRITTTGGQVCGIVTATAAAFDITAGTMYQVCSCASGASGTVLRNVAHPGTGDGLRSMQNALAAISPTFALSTSSTNPCIGGSPPTTTGALDTVIDGSGPIILLLGTNTP